MYACNQINQKLCMLIIVFIPGPVQGPSSSFDRVARVNSFFKKSKRHHLVKNKTKVNGLQPGF